MGIVRYREEVMTVLMKTRSFVTTAIGTAVLAGLVSLPLGSAHGQDAHNMRLVGLDELQARSAYQPIIQEHQNGRFIAYIGHHNGSAPNPLNGGATEINGTSIVDVTNPARPVYLHHIQGDRGAQMVQTCSGDDLPQGDPGKMYLLRSNGNVSHEVWDVTDPSNPTFVSNAAFEAGANATHKNWWDCESGIAYIVYDGRQREWRTNRLLWVVDLSDPADPVFLRNFGLVGQEPGSTGDAPAGVHEVTKFGDRIYFAYGTGNDGIMQVVDDVDLLDCKFPDICATAPMAEELLEPQVGRVDMPTFWGAHTAFPVIGIDVPEQEQFNDSSPRDFVVLVSESLANECNENSHDMVFMVDITDETKPFPVANYQVAESEGDFCTEGGRFGAHSVNWSYNPDFYKKVVVISYFNAGVRAVDIRDPFHPKEVAFFIPDITANTAPRGDKFAIQTNNVEIDSRGFVYLADRANTGLHIVELTGDAKKIVRNK